MEKRIYLSAPHMNGYEQKYIREAFNTNWIAPLGPNVDAFEKELCCYVGVEHGVALSSGTAAIHLALKYLGVSQGDYVFCSSLTFSGSCNAILYEKAIPVFIDCERDSWNMSPKALEKAMRWAELQGKLPKAVIIVDLYGQPADYSTLLEICDHYSIPVIEDAAEALGASYGMCGNEFYQQAKGCSGKCGSFGYIGIFSFNGNKIITTSGGGMAISNNPDAIKKMKFWSTQAREPELHYEHKEIGYNYRMSNICAGIGRGQLITLDDRVAIKKKIFENYKNDFSNIEAIKMMPVSEKGEPNYWLSAITIDKASGVSPLEIINVLCANNVEARPLWKPMHLQPVFKDAPYFGHSADTDISAALFEGGLCLPSGTNMTAEEQEYVIGLVRGLFT